MYVLTEFYRVTLYSLIFIYNRDFITFAKLKFIILLLIVLKLASDDGNSFDYKINTFINKEVITFKLFIDLIY